MFTRNWYYGLAARMLDDETPTITLYPGLKTMSGALPSYCSSINYWSSYVVRASNDLCYAPNINFAQNSLDTNGGVIFGTGTTTPTIDDYKLSGDMITTFTFSKSTTIEHDDEGVTVTAVYTITNSGSDAFTIREVGLMASCYSKSSEQYKCLLERTVLASPVTIPAGGVGQVTYTIRINYPT